MTVYCILCGKKCRSLTDLGSHLSDEHGRGL